MLGRVLLHSYLAMPFVVDGVGEAEGLDPEGVSTVVVAGLGERQSEVADYNEEGCRTDLSGGLAFRLVPKYAPTPTATAMTMTARTPAIIHTRIFRFRCWFIWRGV